MPYDNTNKEKLYKAKMNGKYSNMSEKEYAVMARQDVHWFCDKCNTKLHDTYFKLTDIEKDFLPRFKEYYGSKEIGITTAK